MTFAHVLSRGARPPEFFLDIESVGRPPGLHYDGRMLARNLLGEGMDSLLPLGVLMATTTAVVYLSFRGARAWSQNALMQEHRLLMKATMASYGITSTDVAQAGRAEDFEAARQVCDRCHSIEECLGHLAAHRRDGFEAFCPNAALWQEVHDWKRSAD